MAVEPGRKYRLKHYDLTIEYGFHKTQPTMFVRRQPALAKRGLVFGITLDQAWHYRHDSEHAWESATTATELLGLIPPESDHERLSKTETEKVGYVGSKIEEYLPELLHLPPPPMQDLRKDLEHAVEHYGLTAKVDGEVVLGG